MTLPEPALLLVDDRPENLLALEAVLEPLGYIASHDLQEPLRVIAGYLELLEDRLGDGVDATSREWIDRVTAAAGRMSSLLTDLLAFARAGAGAPQSVPVDLDQCLQV